MPYVVRALLCGNSMLLLLLLSLPVATAADVQFVGRDGNSVDWGTNTIYFGNPQKVGARFKAELGVHGKLMAAGLYRIHIVNGKLSSPDPQVRVDGSSIRIDARLIDESLRCASGIACAQGRIFVAETHSNDCVDKYIYRVDESGALVDRTETVLHPTALVVVKDTAYVLGTDELAAFDLSTKQRWWSTKLDSLGSDFEHMARIGDCLYLSCPQRNEIVRIDIEQGKKIGALTLPAARSAIAKIWRRQALPIAASSSGTLYVGTADGVIELGLDGKTLRTISEINDAIDLAVSSTGDIAVARPAGNSAFSILKLDSAGKPLLKIMKTTWNDFGKETCDCRYLAGLLGKVKWVGGLSFDEAGQLYITDRNDAPKNEHEFRGLGHDMGNDGGIVKLSPAGEVVSRLGSRFTDGSILESRLAERAQRDPLLRTRAMFTAGGKGYIVVYGDSITQVGGDWNGGASDVQHNWTMLLPSMIAANHPKAKLQVDARGIGGNVVYNGLCRAPQPEHVELDAMLYLLEFGTNDVDRPWMPPRRYAQGLTDFVQMLFVYTDGDIGLVTTGPILGKHLYDPAEYRRAVHAVAKQYNLPVVDMTEAVNHALAGRDYATLHLGDEPNRKKEDPHPNTAGHQVWAEAVVTTLEQAVSSPR